LAALEAAYLAREGNQPERAARLAEQAFETSWRSDLAGEARLVHGWLELQAGHIRQAERDFRLAVVAADSQKHLALALFSLAVLEEESGDQADASRLLARAEAVAASRANASGPEIFFDGELDDTAQRAVRGLSARVMRLSEPAR
jgi:tetratricopeptide (TPR) repeat protein